MKRIPIIIVLLFALVACNSGPTNEQIQSTVAAQVVAFELAATPYPTYTPFPTYTPQATYTPRPTIEVTRIVIVTPTDTPTPQYTPTNTAIPTPTPNITATAKAEAIASTATARADALALTAIARAAAATVTAEAVSADATAQAEAFAAMTADRQDGIWLVGVDIAPGLWRNDATTATDCYWKRSTKFGDIIDNFFGNGGGTAYIQPSDFQFETNGCGTWTYLGK